MTTATVRATSWSPPPAGRVRVRWDRVAALLAAVALAAATLMTAAGTSGAAPPVAPPARVVVQPGDTLWDLALAHVPAGEDPLDYVARVVAANSADAGRLQPGSVVRLPR